MQTQQPVTELFNGVLFHAVIPKEDSLWTVSS